MRAIWQIALISFSNSTRVISTVLKAKMKNQRVHLNTSSTLSRETSPLETDFRQANDSNRRFGSFVSCFLWTSSFDVRFTNSTSKLVSETVSRWFVLDSFVGKQMRFDRTLLHSLFLPKVVQLFGAKERQNQQLFLARKMSITNLIPKNRRSFFLFWRAGFVEVGHFSRQEEMIHFWLNSETRWRV